MIDRVRGKFFVMSAKKYANNDSQVVFQFGAVGASDPEKAENVMYHRYTPSGTIEMTIDNPAAAEFFQLGDEVYVDFTIAKKRVPQT